MLQVLALKVSTVVKYTRTLTVFQPFLLTTLFVCRLEELNLSWCEFTAIHVKAAVNHITSKITQLNLSGYREHLQIAGKQQRDKCLSHYGMKQ